MVSPLLTDQKTKTRRTRGLDKVNKAPNDYYFQSLFLHATGRFTFAPCDNFLPTNDDVVEVKCPYGKPGDQLWVRETWCESNTTVGAKYLYKEKLLRESSLSPKWKPSIHMPRAASRILLQVTAIRPERLHDITKEDAIAEGIEILEGQSNFKNYLYGNGLDYSYVKSARLSFETLWKSINGAASWDLNPWVWVISFKRI